jgi:hypothetical protein
MMVMMMILFWMIHRSLMMMISSSVAAAADTKGIGMALDERRGTRLLLLLRQPMDLLLSGMIFQHFSSVVVVKTVSF